MSKSNQQIILTENEDDRNNRNLFVLQKAEDINELQSDEQSQRKSLEKRLIL